MNKASKIKYLVIGSLLALAVGAPLASAVANRPAPVAIAAPVGEVTFGEVTVVPAVVTVPEVVVTGSLRKAATQARKAGSRKATPVRVVSHELRQGGHPGATTVVAWGI